jgi:enterochelin esterase-like enzyme
MVEFSTRFEPIEMSDPALESGGIRNLTFHSEALGGRGDVSLWLPPEDVRTQTMPLVVLLHGVYGSHWSWFQQGAAARTAQRLVSAKQIRPMVIATPSDGLAGDGSGYLPSHPGAAANADYERWIVDDVIDCVRRVIPAATGPAFLAGLSMGGYGALRLGMKWPQRFDAISAHSAITHIDQFAQFVRHAMPLQSKEGPTTPLPAGEADLLHWARLHRAQLPALRFDCGRDDTLAAANVQLHEDLTALGVPHEFELLEGAHTWPYWTVNLEKTLLFFEACCSGTAQ